MRMLTFFMLLAVVANGTTYAQSTNANCGGTSQPRCEITVPVDVDSTATDSDARTKITAANDNAKGLLNSIDPAKFKWSFIPNIPTAECQNLSIQNPIANSYVEMDICSPFNTFKTFMNGVLAVLCVIGCVRQFQSALKA